MVTLDQWYRTYHTIPTEGPTDEDIAYEVIRRKHWVASPALLMHLTKYVRETLNGRKNAEDQARR